MNEMFYGLWLVAKWTAIFVAGAVAFAVVVSGVIGKRADDRPAGHRGPFL